MGRSVELFPLRRVLQAVVGAGVDDYRALGQLRAIAADGP